MDKNLIKNNIYSVLILVAWLSDVINYNASFKKIVSLIIFTVCANVLQIGKNKIKVLLTVAVLSLTAVLIYFEYVFYALPVLLLIISYIEAKETYSSKKNKKENMKGIYLTLFFIAICWELIFVLIKHRENNVEFNYTLKAPVKDYVFVSALFIVLICFCFFRKKQNPHFSMVGILIMAYIGSTITLIFFLTTEEYFIESSRLALSYWILFADILFIDMEKDFKQFFKNTFKVKNKVKLNRRSK